MIAQERAPTLTGRVAFLGHVFGDSRLSHRKAKLEQFTMNVRCPQSRLSTLIRQINARLGFRYIPAGATPSETARYRTAPRSSSNWSLEIDRTVMKNFVIVNSHVRRSFDRSNRPWKRTGARR